MTFPTFAEDLIQDLLFILVWMLSLHSLCRWIQSDQKLGLWRASLLTEKSPRTYEKSPDSKATKRDPIVKKGLELIARPRNSDRARKTLIFEWCGFLEIIESYWCRHHSYWVCCMLFGAFSFFFQLFFWYLPCTCFPAHLRWHHVDLPREGRLEQGDTGDSTPTPAKGNHDFCPQ